MPFPGSQLIHPLLTRLIAHHYPSLAVIQVATATENSFNEPEITYEAIEDLIGIPCYLEKNTTGNDELDRPFQVVVMGAYSCALQGYYPTITRSNRAVIDGTTFDIVDIAIDDFETTTVLGLERINEDSEMPYNG